MANAAEHSEQAAVCFQEPINNFNDQTAFVQTRDWKKEYKRQLFNAYIQTKFKNIRDINIPALLNSSNVIEQCSALLTRLTIGEEQDSRKIMLIIAIAQEYSDILLQQVIAKLPTSLTLHTACEYGITSKLKELINRETNAINMQDAEANTPLHKASSCGQLACARILLHEKALVNIQNKYGYTPLHVAAFYGHNDCVEYLLQANADCNVCSYMGNTALDMAQKGKRRAIVDRLEQAMKQAIA